MAIEITVGQSARRANATYIQQLLEAVEDMDDAIRGVYEFSQGTAVDKMLDCYFSLIKFELAFKTDYENDPNDTDPYQLLALHMILLKLQFDIDDMLTMVNKNTVQSNVSVLKRLFTNNRAFGEVVSVLNKVTRLNLVSKTPIPGGEETTRGDGTPNDRNTPLPTGLSRFDMTVAAGFDTIIGQNVAVNSIKRLVVQTGAVSQPLSLILYGPPGTGKTSIALAIGREYKLKVYAIAVSSLGGHYVGERERNIVEIFNFLESRDEDVLLFVDEADSFLTNVGPNDSPQTQYTHAVTVELFDKFLKPNIKITAAEATGLNANKKRVLLLATNFIENIANEISRKSEKILIDIPRTTEDMRRLVEYYRQFNRVNMTESRLERIAKYSLACELAPSHVSQVMRRIATQVLLDMLKRGVVVRKYQDMKKSVRKPWGMLVSPFYTVGGLAVKRKPELKDTVVRVFNAERENYDTSERIIPLGGTELYGVNELPVNAIYPVYDGNIERFFQSFTNFHPPAGDNGSDKDPEYVEPANDEQYRPKSYKRGGIVQIGLDPDELQLL